MSGSAGNDLLAGDLGNDTLWGGAGTDTIGGGDGNDKLSGGNDADVLSGANGADTIWGDDGDDRLTGGPGNDALFGGNGNDTAVFSGVSSSYVITLGATVTVAGPDGTDHLTGVEFLSFADKTISTSNNPPLAGNDTLANVAEDSGQRTIAAATLLANDSDVDHDTLTIASVGNAVGGVVLLSGSNILFTPTADFNGPASFAYSVSDGHGGTANASASFAVTAVNDLPTAVAPRR